VGFWEIPKIPDRLGGENRMKFGFRRPSLKKRIAARTSVKRAIRHRLGIKAPRGLGWLTNPKKALYNRVYSRTTRGCLILMMTTGVATMLPLVLLTIWLIR
jgi:hypothetical protein